MATGKPPWSYKGKNHIAIMMRIARTKKPPKIPKELSEDAQDFIQQCFKINPSDRSNVYELLRHPFITGAIDQPIRTPDSFIDEFRGESLVRSETCVQRPTSDNEVTKSSTVYDNNHE